jgi:hypothetical protein
MARLFCNSVTVMGLLLVVKNLTLSNLDYVTLSGSACQSERGLCLRYNFKLSPGLSERSHWWRGT